MEEALVPNTALAFQGGCTIYSPLRVTDERYALWARKTCCSYSHMRYESRVVDEAFAGNWFVWRRYTSDPMLLLGGTP